MSLRYEEVARLQRGLRGGVSAVAFSSDGTYIATAGMEDRTVYIWRVEDSKLLHTYTGSDCPFLSLEWMPDRSDTIFCGSSDGHISVLRFGSDITAVSGFWAHDYPIERLAAKEDQLVSGAHREVSVWQQLNRGGWSHVVNLDGPSTDSKNAEEEFIVMGIHWTKTRAYKSVVVLTYMHHGIVIYDSTTWSLLQVIPFSDIGASSMSPLGSTIALSIMGAGFDLYDLDSGVCLASFADESDGQRTVPVLLVHGGRALLGGGTAGRATLWNVHNKRIHQRFTPEPYDTILAIAAHYNYGLDQFLVATGASDTEGNSAVVIWMARPDAPRKPRRQCRWVLISCFVFPVLVCIAAAVFITVMEDVL
ncbi:WD40 repeat-like protein [Lentinus tigrinus ALCF2SS1-7]|uniref:WD40 repeat-like protein n=1 Tax=Lentinus tigrinus ALCF2SS1-7 TaxID=1328758 RepID=UPI001165D16E|nr:WD40 repeat-like protein [Lentinus tigrinus ALCF2SS1-7]